MTSPLSALLVMTASLRHVRRGHRRIPQQPVVVQNHVIAGIFHQYTGCAKGCTLVCIMKYRRSARVSSKWQDQHNLHPSTSLLAQLGPQAHLDHALGRATIQVDAKAPPTLLRVDGMPEEGPCLQPASRPRDLHGGDPWGSRDGSLNERGHAWRHGTARQIARPAG